MPRRFVLALLLASGACLSSEEERCRLLWAEEPASPKVYAEPTPCDPQVRTTAIRLQPPVVVGQRDDGTLVVLDRVDDPASSRLFESEGEALRRRAVEVEVRREGEDLFVAFVGESSSGVVRFGDAMTVPANIVPEETALVLTSAPPSDALAQAFEGGTPLEVRSECVAAGRELIDLPQRNVVEYLAHDEDGQRILVVRPELGWDVTSATLFYGPPDAVLQRTVTAFGRRRDGGTTDIVFDYPDDGAGPEDGAGNEARLRFVVGCDGPFTRECEGTLDLPGGTRTVSVPQREVAVPEGETYLCHDH